MDDFSCHWDKRKKRLTILRNLVVLNKYINGMPIKEIAKHHNLSTHYVCNLVTFTIEDVAYFAIEEGYNSWYFKNIVRENIKENSLCDLCAALR